MADPVVHITAGIPDSGTGNITTLGQTLLDGANATHGITTGAAVTTNAAGTLQQYLRGLVTLFTTATFKAASTAPLATDPALVVAISPNGQNLNGSAADAQSTPVAWSTEGKAQLGSLTETAPTTDTASSGLNGRLQRIAQRITSLIALLPAALGAGGGLKVDGSGTALPVSVAPSTTDVPVTPTVTASIYTANNCIGGIMTFASILAATSFNGVLQSITAKFKGTAVTGTINVHIFKASPSNGTYTDKTAVTWNALDMANLLGTYQLTAPLSTLGTMTTYNLDGIGKALVGASTSLFVVATVAGTPTPASTSDFTLELSVLPG